MTYNDYSDNSINSNNFNVENNNESTSLSEIIDKFFSQDTPLQSHPLSDSDLVSTIKSHPLADSDLVSTIDSHSVDKLDNISDNTFKKLSVDLELKNNSFDDESQIYKYLSIFYSNSNFNTTVSTIVNSIISTVRPSNSSGLYLCLVFFAGGFTFIPTAITTTQPEVQNQPSKSFVYDKDSMIQAIHSVKTQYKGKTNQEDGDEDPEENKNRLAKLKSSHYEDLSEDDFWFLCISILTGQLEVMSNSEMKNFLEAAKKFNANDKRFNVVHRMFSYYKNSNPSQATLIYESKGELKKRYMFQKIKKNQTNTPYWLVTIPEEQRKLDRLFTSTETRNRRRGAQSGSSYD